MPHCLSFEWNVATAVAVAEDHHFTYVPDIEPVLEISNGILRRVRMPIRSIFIKARRQPKYINGLRRDEPI
jgi:hypothetical protein